MVLNDTLLFCVTAVHIGAVMLMMIYCMQKLSDLREARILPQECCAKLNVLVVIKVVIHGLSSLLLILHGHRVLFTFDLLMLCWRCSQIIMKGSNGVYNPDTILEFDEIEKYKWYHKYAISYFGLSLCIYVTLIFFGSNSLLYIITIGLIHAMIVIMAFYLMTFSDIEFEINNDHSRARRLCSQLNAMLPVKLLLHAMLTSVLLAYGYWILFISNLPVLAIEILEITTIRETCFGVYDPRTIVLSNDHRACCNKYMGFLLFSLYLSTYFMIGESGSPLVIPLELRYTIVAIVAVLPCITPIVSIILLGLCGTLPHEVDAVLYCNWLNALFYINTLLHMHICTFLLVHGHWVNFCFNLLLLYLQVHETLTVQEYTFGVYSVAEVRRRQDVAQLIYMFMHYLIYYAGLCVANVYCLYLVHSKDMLFQVSLMWHKQGLTLV